MMEKNDFLWLVQLEGPTYKLKYLLQDFDENDLTIIGLEDKYYLTSHMWDEIEDVDKINKITLEWLKLVNININFHLQDDLPISIARIINNKNGEEKVSYVLGSVSFMGKSFLFARASLNAKTNVQSETQLDKSIRLSNKYPAVCDVLYFYNEGTWVSLYKAYEMIRDDLKSECQDFIKLSWTTHNEENRLTQTAQSKEAIGYDARHAARKFKPPQEPMTIEEAKSFIYSLINKWLAMKK